MVRAGDNFLGNNFWAWSSGAVWADATFATIFLINSQYIIKDRVELYEWSKQCKRMLNYKQKFFKNYIYIVFPDLP